MCASHAALRVLIADDEAPARRQLHRVLQALPGVEWVGEAGDGLEALRLAAALQPDVLLLDIAMPLMGGLDVAANLAAPAPLVVFVTAYDEHAVRAFELAAVDYLLKPWDAERLLHALERARARLRRGERPPATPPRIGPLQRLVVPAGDALHVVALDDVRVITAQDNYVMLGTGERDWLLREPLGTLVERLQNPEIVRVHRSHAVNLRHVLAYARHPGGDGDITLAGERHVPCSRTYRELFLRRLQART
jgi:two-component system LytT family response regulator